MPLPSGRAAQAVCVPLGASVFLSAAALASQACGFWVRRPGAVPGQAPWGTGSTRRRLRPVLCPMLLGALMAEPAFVPASSGLKPRESLASRGGVDGTCYSFSYWLPGDLSPLPTDVTSLSPSCVPVPWPIGVSGIAHVNSLHLKFSLRTELRIWHHQ